MSGTLDRKKSRARPGGRARLSGNRVLERTSFLLRTEESYDTHSQRVLMIGRARGTALE